MAIRIISSVVGIVFAVLVLWLSDTLFFNLVIAAISCIMLYELFSAEKSIKHRYFVITSFIYAVSMCIFTLPDLVQYRNYLSIVYTFFMFLGYVTHHKKINCESLFFMTGSALMISYSMCCILSLNYLNETHGVMYVVLALCGAWLADSGAYFVGTFFGKHKLCPDISPKKTIEGLIGGVITNGLLFVAFNLVYSRFFVADNVEFNVNYVLVFILGTLCALVGLIGDLSASLIKRQYQIKDYGNIMPGHGGLMDRFDSVLFVVPFVYAFIQVFKVYY